MTFVKHFVKKKICVWKKDLLRLKTRRTFLQVYLDTLRCQPPPPVSPYPVLSVSLDFFEIGSKHVDLRSGVDLGVFVREATTYMSWWFGSKMMRNPWGCQQTRMFDVWLGGFLLAATQIVGTQKWILTLIFVKILWKEQDVVYRILTSWWFQHIWKILVKLDHFPK